MTPALPSPLRVARLALPPVLLALAGSPRASGRQRAASVAALLGLWTAVYARYRATGRTQTAREYELLRTATREAFARHYNERVPTIEEEFELWGAYHQHRHEMRYDLVADAVRRHLPSSGRVLDIGCGSALVADRIQDLPGRYLGLDFGGHHVSYAAKKYADFAGPLCPDFVRGDGQRLPLADASVDVVVLSEVIEHLVQPELAVWEVARVLRPGGVLVMTTNNASEMPLRSPLSHLFAWLEKAFGATHPALISSRPWVWPWPVDRDLLPPDAPEVYLPHTHHIQAQTAAMFRAAGLSTFCWSTFEFPPPQAAAARWLDARGAAGRRAVDVVEAMARRTPLVRRLGCHLMMLARREPGTGTANPPPGIWPGPFSR